MTGLLDPDLPAAAEPRSLGTRAARQLTTTTKTVPQMQEITPRWLLRSLPWVEAKGAAYRVNRRLTYALGDGLVSFSNVGDAVSVVPPELRELPMLRGFADTPELTALTAVAQRFGQRDVAAGEVVARAGEPADTLYLVAHGKLTATTSGRYGEPVTVAVLADGGFFGDQELLEPGSTWSHTITANTSAILMTLPRADFEELLGRLPALGAHLELYRAAPKAPRNKYGEAEIALAAGHYGEVELPGTYVDYELTPREYELSVAQTVLRVHTRVADLYNNPMNQVQQQLRLTVEALRERQEHELLNNPEFGLLHNVDLRQRLHTEEGPPTPADLDQLLSRRKRTDLLLAHPKAIAAFGRQCTRLGVYPPPVPVDGRPMQSWRGVPMLPCDKIPISPTNTTTILAMRVGEDSQGVIGLRETGIPDEVEPGLSVRFMGIDERAIMSYLVSAYHSAAVLVPDALGALQNVQLGL